jgi:hypothetical protein
MNTAVIARAVLTRLKADSTLWDTVGGAWKTPLAGGASFSKGNPSTLVFPFLVYGVTWNADQNAFDGIEGRSEITFSIYDEDTQGTSRLEVIIDRLIGDAMLSSGTRSVPTYGFHNHLLDLPALGATNIQGANSERWTLISSEITPSESLQANTAVMVFSGRVGNLAANI